MAVRHFEYAEAKNTMSKIQSEASNVEKYLARCEEIVNENVGVENRWSVQEQMLLKKNGKRLHQNSKNL